MTSRSRALRPTPGRVRAFGCFRQNILFPLASGPVVPTPLGAGSGTIPEPCHHLPRAGGGGTADPGKNRASAPLEIPFFAFPIHQVLR